MSERSRGSRVLAACGWSALGAAAAPAGVLIEHAIMVEGERSGSFHLGVGIGASVGLLAGLVIGLRSRSLLGLMLAPAVGLVAGVADLRVAVWLYGQVDPNAGFFEWIAMVPVWSCVLGCAVAVTHRSYRGAALSLILLIAADVLSRWSVTQFWHPGAGRVSGESLAFVLPCALAVLLTRPWRAQGARPRNRAIVSPTCAAS